MRKEKLENHTTVQMTSFVFIDSEGSCFGLGFPPRHIARVIKWTRVFVLFFFLNPDSANNCRLVFSAVVTSRPSHHAEYQEITAPGETGKRPCLS